MTTPAILALEDGSVFRGVSIGSTGAAVGEVVFNTAMTGYQEIITNPACVRQIVTLTYPHIGNVGVNKDDDESAHGLAAGLVIRDASMVASSFRAEESLTDYLVRRGVVGIAEIDTRRLTRLLRDKGVQRGCILAGPDLDEQVAIARARELADSSDMDLIGEVTTVEPYTWTLGGWSLRDGFSLPDEEELPWHVVAYDYGCTRNSLRALVDRGCRVTVVPASTAANEVLAMNPDGVFLSGGPGNAACSKYAPMVQDLLRSEVPVFGLCAGHQMLALASGAHIEKIASGHRGANHPVQDLERGTVTITRQNHGFIVDEATLPTTLKVTHRSAFDDTVQGLRRTDRPAFSLQGYPQVGAAPGGAPSPYEQFVELIRAYRS